MEMVRFFSIDYPFHRVMVVQAKNARYAILNPAPSVQSRTIWGSTRLMRSQTTIIVTGLTAAIQRGKAVLPEATSTEKKDRSDDDKKQYRCIGDDQNFSM